MSLLPVSDSVPTVYVYEVMNFSWLHLLKYFLNVHFKHKSTSAAVFMRLAFPFNPQNIPFKF